MNPGGKLLDPRGTLRDARQVLPLPGQIHHVMEPSMEAGAVLFIGSLTDYPGDACRYYVPYDAVARGIPGVWIRGSDGARLREKLKRGRVHVWLRVDSVREESESRNVIGELPGPDQETVLVGSHHDGPWSSAVEDASGVALVLAQADYWSQVSPKERPHNMTFLLTAAHMAGSAGTKAFIADHAEELKRIVLEIHLEHAAAEFVEKNGRLEATGEPEPRWFFTSEIPELEKTVVEILTSENIDRALIIRPTTFGPQPTTDGGSFHPAGVPIVNYLTAPFYLFDPIDRMDKIHKPSLEPITRHGASDRMDDWSIGRTDARCRPGGWCVNAPAILTLLAAGVVGHCFRMAALRTCVGSVSVRRRERSECTGCCRHVLHRYTAASGRSR